MSPRRMVLPITLFALAGLACSSSTDYGSNGGNNPPPSADVLIVSGAQNKGANAFDPNPFTVALNGGASVNVKWGNADGITHTVTQDGANPAFNHSLSKGSTFTFAFTTAGTYNYHCSIHPSMTGSIVVNP